MSNRRLTRMSEEIKKLVSNLIVSEIKDPRISTLTSVIDVDLTKDLSFATIYISILGSDKEKEDTLKGLESAKGYIRKEISREINLRHTPEIIFKSDSSVEHGLKIEEVLKNIKK